MEPINRHGIVSQGDDMLSLLDFEKTYELLLSMTTHANQQAMTL